MKPWTLLIILGLTACGTQAYKPKSPSTSVTTVDGNVITASGDSPTPAHVNTTTATSSLPLPQAQLMVFDSTSGKYEFTLGKPSLLTTKAVSTAVTGPVAFTPPSPPTLSQVKSEDRKTYLYIALFVGIAAAIFGLVEQWHMVMVGGAVVALAAYVGIFVENHPWVTLAIAAAGGFAVAGPYVWHVLGHKAVTKDLTIGTVTKIPNP